MTLHELQDKLGEQIDLLTDNTMSWERKAEVIKTSQVVSSLAKQMINNADVVLRTEKLISDGKLRGSKIEGML